MPAEHLFQFALAETADVSQARISPGIGTVENHDLIAGIENDIAIVRMGLHILTGQAGSQRADLLEAAVHGHPYCQRLFFYQFGKCRDGFVFFPVNGDSHTADL